jgi:transposase-like protein
MTLEQSQATESQVRYSPEEAHEILRLAAEMQESALSVEQLRRIAQEAGIADEYLGRAIQHYEQRRGKRFRKRLYATPRERRFKRAVWTLVASGVVVALSLLWNIVDNTRAFANDTRSYPLDSLADHLRSEVFSPYRAPQFAPMTPLASSPALEVYKVRWRDWEWREGILVRVPQERVFIRRSGMPFPVAVNHRFRHVVAAEISPSGKYVALYDAGTGEVWVVDAQGKVQLGSRIEVGSALGGEPSGGKSPTLEWLTRGDNEILHIRLADGRTITVTLP